MVPANSSFVNPVLFGEQKNILSLVMNYPGEYGEMSQSSAGTSLSFKCVKW